MFTHDDMWAAIDRLAEGHGYSPSGLAKKAGLDPTTFNKSKRVSNDGKPRWPSTESIAKILAVTGTPMADFIALMNLNTQEQAPSATIPMINTALAGKASHFDEQGLPRGDQWDEFLFPVTLHIRDKSIFALEVSNEALTPVYREGDVLVVSPEANIRRGDRIVVRTTKGELVIHELRRQTANRIELRAIDAPGQSRHIELDQISWMARIIWVSQ
ncbi:MAG TPA: helix-turn-helix transcriptional regulator [Micavibrio sp.]